MRREYRDVGMGTVQGWMFHTTTTVHVRRNNSQQKQIDIEILFCIWKPFLSRKQIKSVFVLQFFNKTK